MRQHPSGDPHRFDVDTTAPLRDRCFWASFLLGIGTMAALDEIVFHQILGWHHFYDLSTPAVGLAADGILHAAELLALAAGVVLLLDARRRRGVAPLIGVSGYLIGLGLFQLWDGVIHHKVLRVHQIRYGVDLLPYDLAWIAAALALLAAGVVIALFATRHVRRRGTRG